jgi:hypothetical protein
VYISTGNAGETSLGRHADSKSIISIGPANRGLQYYKDPHRSMSYLMEIAFDNSRRLARKRYVFEYRGVQFKLVQDNPRKWADHLLTIIPEYDKSNRERVFSIASEFLSALGWQNRASAAIWIAGGRSLPAGRSVKQVEPCSFTFPRIPFGGNIVGYDITPLPHIETEEQRVALGLYREANASNNDFLSFLFFWQILETGGGDPVGFINRARSKDRDRLGLISRDIAHLPLDGKSLGKYLLDDCRHAIAHIRRKPGKEHLDVDKASERFRLKLSSGVVKAFAEHYIRERLSLRNSLFLGIKKRGDIPVYIDLSALRSGQYIPYPRPTTKSHTIIKGRFVKAHRFRVSS